MLQVFELLSKTCNMLPQRNVAFKVALAPCHTISIFNATMFAFKVGVKNWFVKHHLKGRNRFSEKLRKSATVCLHGCVRLFIQVLVRGKNNFDYY